MNEVSGVDYKIWDLENDFLSITAACLWCEIDPCEESRDQSMRKKVLKMAEILEKAAETGKIECAKPSETKITIKKSWVFPEKVLYHTKKIRPIFKRKGLRAYAESVSQRPLFLFPEDRGSEQSTAIQNVFKDSLQLFDALLLHPKITKVSKKLFADTHYALAIFEAFKAVNNAVKKKSGIKDKDGQALMGYVFNEERPIIRLNSLKTQSDKDEQNGFKLLYMGAMTGIRNPKAHDHIIQSDPSRTLKYLALASLLMEKIDKSTRSRRRQGPMRRPVDISDK